MNSCRTCPFLNKLEACELTMLRMARIRSCPQKRIRRAVRQAEAAGAASACTRSSRNLNHAHPEGARGNVSKLDTAT